MVFSDPMLGTMTVPEEDLLRKNMRSLLEQGLETEREPRAYTSEAINAIVHRLQLLSPDQYKEKLQIAGFAVTPYRPSNEEEDIVQSCETCMYYLVHRRFCELPELALPVEKDWCCRLWRI